MRGETRRKWRWVLLTGLALASVPVLLILAQPRARASLGLVAGFSELPADPRVRFEAGAEGWARALAEALPEVVARVEACQRARFQAPFRVVVCASHGSFARRTGEPADSPVRGFAFARSVWISPLAFSFHGQDTHRESLAHELSHLHLTQNLGWWRRTREVPGWFQEGLADRVAGTGYEQVSRSEAREAILAGRTFALAAAGHSPLRMRLADPGVAWPMLHAQSRTFVEYLEARDVEAYGRFVGAVVGGARFEDAFGDCFGRSLPVAWAEFEGALEEEAPGP